MFWGTTIPKQMCHCHGEDGEEPETGPDNVDEKNMTTRQHMTAKKPEYGSRRLELQFLK